LAKKYLSDKLLPGSASELMREAISYVKASGKKVVYEDDIVLLIENKTRIPVTKAARGEADDLLNMENIIHQKLVNQEEAVKSVSDALREYRAGLSKSKGPIATFLFVGPTGVGKTELSKVLANIYFGSEEKMIRFDMAEFQDDDSISRFIGSQDGKTVGLLTEAVKQNPFSLVLLDEFEKANPKILNLFLAVFDEGRLTDRLGKLVDFNNTIIICTSNALSDFIKDEIDKGTDYNILSDMLKKKLTSVFRPELLNRFSKILIFKQLSEAHILEIARLHLNKLKNILLKEQSVYLEISENAVKKIADIGYDPAFGARPLEGAIRESIRNKLASAILRQEFKKGNVVLVDFVENEFVLKVVGNKN
jgi:ATP-dependent Clp protease ATP-binding subunit ClpC